MGRRTLSYDQGELDGFCGIYSVVNALNLLVQNADVPEFSNRIFEVVLRAIPRRMYPDVLLVGTDIDDLRKIGRAATKHLNLEWDLQVQMEQPFAKRRFKDQAAFLDELDLLLADGDAVAILGIEWDQASGHWTVLKKIESNVLKLIDSDGGKQLDRRGTSIHPGSKARLCPTETVVFRLTGINGTPLSQIQ